MQPARQRNDAPPEPTLAEFIAAAGETRQRAETELARTEAILAAIEQGTPPPDWVTAHQLTMIAAGLRQAGGGAHAVAEQAQVLAGRMAVADAALACERATGFQQGVSAAAGRHRAPRKRQPGRGQLTLIPGKGTAAVSGILGVAQLHRLAVVKGAVATTAAAGLVAASTAGVVHLADVSQVPSAHPAATSPLPALAPATAIPFPLPPQSEPSYAARHAKPGAPDAKTATPVPSPTPSVTLTPPSSPPQPSPQPVVAAGGTLTLQTVQVSIGAGGTGMLTFYSEGGALEWHAFSSSPDLSIDRSGGILGDGQSAMITVTVAHGTLAGAATVTITAGGQEENVPVTWVSVPGL